MKAKTRAHERARLHVLMMLMLILRKIQRDRPVCFSVDKLLHFRVSARANFFRCALRDDRTMTEHDHARRNAKSARHVVRDDDCGHVASMSQFER